MFKLKSIPNLVCKAIVRYPLQVHAKPNKHAKEREWEQTVTCNFFYGNEAEMET